MWFDNADEVVEVFLLGILDTHVIDDKRKDDIAFFMGEEAIDEWMF